MAWPMFKEKILALDFNILLASSLLACAVFMWIGARLVRVHRANIFKAILVAILGTAVAWAARYALTVLVPLAGQIFGFLLGYFLVLLIIKAVFQTSLIRALGVWIFFLLAQPVFVFLMGRSFFGDLDNYFWKGLPF